MITEEYKKKVIEKYFSELKNENYNRSKLGITEYLPVVPFEIIKNSATDICIEDFMDKYNNGEINKNHLLDLHLIGKLSGIDMLFLWVEHQNFLKNTK